MKKLSLSTFVLFNLLVFSSQAQDRFVLENPGKLFKKQEHRSPSPLKTRYAFGVGEASGREYLMQQDLYGTDGKIKSSGLFAEDGNKSTDVRYSYKADGSLEKKVQKYLGKNLQETTYYNSTGQPDHMDVATKTDSLLYTVRYTYLSNGSINEELSYRGETLIGKKVNDDAFNQAGRKTQECHYMIDSTGARKPQNAPMTITEYDPDGLILQLTKYNNKEKRKMLSWVYYKYQLDNDYKVIKQTGFDEEQKEIYRNELTYTDSSIVSEVYAVCDCAEKTLEKKEIITYVFNTYGEKIRELRSDANGNLLSTLTWLYDDFGNEIEHVEVLTSDPAKLIKRKQIFEFRTDQAQTVKKPAK